jgi:hypothetical protein
MYIRYILPADIIIYLQTVYDTKSSDHCTPGLHRINVFEICFLVHVMNGS